MNIDQLVDLVYFFEQVANGEAVVGFYSHVKYPIICDYDIAPTEWKLRVADQLERKLHRLNKKENRHGVQTHVDGLRRETFSESDKKLYQKMFVRYNDTQDRFRKNTKTWRELLPDLESAIKL